MRAFHISGFIFFTLAWLAYDHYRPWVNFHSEAAALFGIGLLAVSCSFKQGTVYLVAPRLLLAVFAVAVIPWAQFLLGISLFAGDAVINSLYLCAFIVAIWLGYLYALKPVDINYAPAGVFFMLAFSALASAAIGLVQWLHLQEPIGMYVVQTEFGQRAMGNLGQPNQLATLLLMGTASLAWAFESKRIGKVGLIVGVTFLTLGFALSRSRAGLISALVIAVFLLWKSRTNTARLTSKYILAWISMCCAMFFLNPLLKDFLMLGDKHSLIVGVDNERALIWRQVLSGISQAPWIGYGWNQTSTAHTAASIAVPGSLTFTYAHNIVLDLLAWCGVPLGILLTGLCAWWILTRIWYVRQPVAIYAMAALIPVLVHSMVEYPFAYSYFLLASGLMVGIVEAFHTGVRAIAFHVRWMRAFLTVWFVIGGYLAYQYLLIEEDFRVVRFENLRIGQTPKDYAIPDVWMLSHMAAMLNASRQRPVPGMSREEIENLRLAALRFPYGALGVRYAIALGLNGFPAEATHQFSVIRGMYGIVYYNDAVTLLRELQSEKYPQLSRVITP